MSLVDRHKAKANSKLTESKEQTTTHDWCVTGLLQKFKKFCLGSWDSANPASAASADDTVSYIANGATTEHHQHRETEAENVVWEEETIQDEWEEVTIIENEDWEEETIASINSITTI